MNCLNTSPNEYNNYKVADQNPCDDDSMIEAAVIESLDASNRREKEKVHPPVHIQEAMLKKAFPVLSKGDEAARLTEFEYTKLRISMQGYVSGKASQTIAILQEQLTEYHDVLEQLHLITTQFQTLIKQNQALAVAFKDECRKRDEKISSLEQEIFDLKKDDLSERNDIPEFIGCMSSQGNGKNNLSACSPFPLDCDNLAHPSYETLRNSCHSNKTSNISSVTCNSDCRQGSFHDEQKITCLSQNKFTSSLEFDSLSGQKQSEFDRGMPFRRKRHASMSDDKTNMILDASDGSSTNRGNMDDCISGKRRANSCDTILGRALSEIHTDKKRKSEDFLSSVTLFERL